MKKSILFFLVFTLLAFGLNAKTMEGHLKNGSKLTLKVDVPTNIDTKLQSVNVLIDSIENKISSNLSEEKNLLDDISLNVTYKNEKFNFVLETKFSENNNLLYYSSINVVSAYVYQEILDIAYCLWFLNSFKEDSDLYNDVKEINTSFQAVFLNNRGKAILNFEYIVKKSSYGPSYLVMNRTNPITFVVGDKIITAYDKNLSNSYYTVESFERPSFNSVKNTWNPSYYIYYYLGKFDEIETFPIPSDLRNSSLAVRKTDFNNYWNFLTTGNFSEALKIKEKYSISINKKNDQNLTTLDFLILKKADLEILNRFIGNQDIYCSNELIDSLLGDLDYLATIMPIMDNNKQKTLFENISNKIISDKEKTLLFSKKVECPIINYFAAIYDSNIELLVKERDKFNELLDSAEILEKTLELLETDYVKEFVNKVVDLGITEFGTSTYSSPLPIKSTKYEDFRYYWDFESFTSNFIIIDNIDFYKTSENCKLFIELIEANMGVIAAKKSYKISNNEYDENYGYWIFFTKFDCLSKIKYFDGTVNSLLINELKQKNYDFAMWLAENGFNCNATDENGKTVLEYMQESGNKRYINRIKKMTR